MANDLSLLARVFIRYRSALDTNYPECQEIIGILNDAGLDVMNWRNEEINAFFTNVDVYTRTMVTTGDMQDFGGEVGSGTLPVKPRGKRKAVIEDSEPDESTDENIEGE